MRTRFVQSVLKSLLREGVIKNSDHVLTVCAGEAERDVFSQLGFTHVLISNLDERMREEQFRPFAFQHEDAQRLSFEDGSFDVAFVADGLHHCRSPHAALVELYRVARRTVIVIESRDSFAMRLASRLGLTPRYELESVVDHNFQYEGVDNTPVPNFIYRWTESEFKKALRSYDPTGRQTFKFFYALNLPYEMAKLRRRRLKLWALRLATPVAKLFALLFKRQCNSFAMVATRPNYPADLWPWLAQERGEIVFDRSYADKHFKTRRQDTSEQT